MNQITTHISRLQMTRILLTILMSVLVVTIQAASVTSNTSGNWSASAWPNTNRTGTITTSTTSNTITGIGTQFTTEISVGNIIKNSGSATIGTVASITDNTHLVLTANAAYTISGLAYKSQGVGPVDAVTINSGVIITVDGAYTCASIAFAKAAANTTLSISGMNALTVSGTITMERPTNNSYIYSWFLEYDGFNFRKK
jgi:hypothetical protein